MMHIVELRENGYNIWKRIKDDDIQEYAEKRMLEGGIMFLAIYTQDEFGEFSVLQFAECW